MRQKYFLYTYTFKHECWPVLVIFCVASMGWRKGCIGFGADWIKTGCHGNQKLLLTYNGGKVTLELFASIVEKSHERHSLGHSPFIYYQIFMKLADNLSRHKTLHVFKILPEWTIYYGVTCFDCCKDYIWPSGHVGLRWKIVCPLGDLFAKIGRTQVCFSTLMQRTLQQSKHHFWGCSGSHNKAFRAEFLFLSEGII